MNFEKAVLEVIKVEGGYVDHPNDRGGATNYGITMEVLRDHLGKDITKDDVRNMNIHTAKEIYKKEYWDRLRLDFVMDKRVSQVIFDQAVNRGVIRVARQVQRIVKVKEDGIIGPISLGAINKYDPIQFIIDFFKVSQISYLNIVRNNPSQIVFLNGWINRTHKMLDAI